MRRCRTCAAVVGDDDPWDARRCRDCARARYARKRLLAAPEVRSAAHDGSVPAVPVRVVTLEEIARRLAEDDARLERARQRAAAAQTAAAHEQALAEIAAATAAVQARRAELAELEALMTARPRGR